MTENHLISFENLKSISIDLRKNYNFLRMQNSHLGSCLSCIDLLVYLYWIKLNINPKTLNQTLGIDLF